MDLKLRSYIMDVTRNMSDEDVALVAGCADHQTLKKGQPILNEGDVCRSFYLVETGYLRTWYNKDGVPINLNFTFEGSFSANMQSIKSHKGSQFIIEAGEDASVWIFDIDRMVARSKAPAIAHFIRRLAIRVLLASEEHSNLFKLYTPTERYKYIEENRPQLLQRISLSQMASYLGVTRETLSRIRRKR